MKLRYRRLTNHQKNILTNGCGGKGGIVKVPNFFFKASCNQHDFYYWRGSNVWHRFIADWEFYLVMIEDIRENVKWYNIYRRLRYLFVATIYFFAVRTFGWKYFYYGKKQRGKKELILELKKFKNS